MKRSKRSIANLLRGETGAVALPHTLIAEHVWGLFWFQLGSVILPSVEVLQIL